MATMSDVVKFMMGNPFPKFRPSIVHEPITDTLMVYAKNVSSYGSRLNSRFTIFKGHSDGELIGFEIKGISRVINANTDLALHVTKSTVKIMDAVRMALTMDLEEPVAVDPQTTIASIQFLLQTSNLENEEIVDRELQLSR
jgi:hypothetical protein